MDLYSVCQLYHTALVSWFDNEDHENILVSIKNIPLSIFFIHLCKQFPQHAILLIATDGTITTITKMEDATPFPFKKKRFMKIDNKSCVSSIKYVLPVLFQLLSISIENDQIELLDLIGLLQFLILLYQENPNIQLHCNEMTIYLKTQFYTCPDFVQNEIIWKKRYRDTILSNWFHQSKDQEHFELLETVQSCHRMIKQLGDIISLQEERISWLEGDLSTLHNNSNDSIHSSDSNKTIND